MVNGKNNTIDIESSMTTYIEYVYALEESY